MRDEPYRYLPVMFLGDVLVRLVGRSVFELVGHTGACGLQLAHPRSGCGGV